MHARAYLVAALAIAACKPDHHGDRGSAAAPATDLSDPYTAARTRMVDTTIAARGIADRRVLDAMRFVPRHEFVPPDARARAYEDSPLPIGFGLTISQPYIVALMTEAAHVRDGDRVLEIGTGSGYQAAVLAALGAKVYTMEIDEDLGRRTRAVLAHLGEKDIELRVGDGYDGWPEVAPFDAILVTCAAPRVPDRLVAQLKEGGRIVLPIDSGTRQELVAYERHNGLPVAVQELLEVRFGPMRGKITSEGGY